MSVSQNLDRIIFNHEEAGDYTLYASQAIQYLWSLKPKERGLLLFYHKEKGAVSVLKYVYKYFDNWIMLTFKG